MQRQATPASILRSAAAFALVAAAVASWPVSALAQGDGGSQTSCELKYSTCKQTVRANYQFCIQSSGGGCRTTLNKALKQCSAAQTRCNNATGNY